VSFGGSNLALYRAESAEIFDELIKYAARYEHRAQSDDEQRVIDAELWLRNCDADCRRRD
jgi:hypothetical protein